MSHGLPKISMFRSWGRLQAHTHTPSHHRHQYIRTLYRGSPENLQHGDTTHWLLASRESSDSKRNASSSCRICAVANATVGVGQAVVWRRWPPAVAIATRSPAVNTTKHDFKLNRSRRYFHAANIHYPHFTSTQLSWTVLRYVMCIDMILELGTVNLYQIFLSVTLTYGSIMTRFIINNHTLSLIIHTLNASSLLLVQQIGNFITMKD